MGLRKFICKTVLQGRGEAHTPQDALAEQSMLNSSAGTSRDDSLKLEASELGNNDVQVGLLPHLIKEDIFGPSAKFDDDEPGRGSGSNLDSEMYSNINELNSWAHSGPMLARPFAPTAPQANVQVELDEALPWSSGSEPEGEIEPRHVQMMCNPMGLTVTQSGLFEMKDIELCSQKCASFERRQSQRHYLDSPASGYNASAPAFVPVPGSSRRTSSSFGGSSYLRRSSSSAQSSEDEGISALELEAVATQMDLRAAQLHAAAAQVEKAVAAAKVKAAAALATVQAPPQNWTDMSAWSYGGPSPGYYDWMVPGMYENGLNGPAGFSGNAQQMGRRVDHSASQQQVQQQRKKKDATPAAATPARSKAFSAGSKLEMSVADEERTTIMLRNIPNNYTRQMLQELLDSKGFSARYDFVYLPMDFRSAAGLGYAFINLVSHKDATEVFEKFQGFTDWKAVSQKVCEVAWGHPLQGLQAHIERYRNSPVMHKDVQPEFRPAIFQNGVQITFPAPTKAVHAPRNKRGKVDGSTPSGLGQTEGSDIASDRLMLG